MSRAKLGAKVRDTITGFEGVVVARTEWLNGCARVAVQGEAREGKIPDAEWIDEEQIQGVASSGKPGGPRQDPSGSRDPGRR